MREKNKNKKMKEYEYEQLLDRALRQLPEGSGTAAEGEADSRFAVPMLRVFVEGKTTIFDNFDAVCGYINREQEHLMKFLLNELGTAGKKEGSRAIFQGQFSREVVEQQIQRYLDEFVLCWECKKPDTHFVKMDRVWVLKCDACGAVRPIMKRKGVKARK
ncbi:translation initiation factor IF-2 subunit beta [ANME-1 cluster archaeon ex4572_4]|nr:MAG: translation initiation factor IF-2 subunit beta [ANME-1 cluster archaeon ex4572_4]